MIRTSHWLIGAAAMLALAGPVLADTAAPPATDSAASEPHHGWHGHRGGPMMFMHVLHQLNLTAEQKTQIKSIFQSAHPQLRARMDSERQNHEALLSTAPTDPSYPALLQTAKDNAVAHVEQMHQLYVQIYSVLTPEQQAQIPKIIAAQKAKWQAHHAQGGSA